MRSRYLYLPLTLFFFLLLTLILGIVFSLVFVGAVGRAFQRVFGSWTIALLVFLSSLLGSSVNLPLGSVKTKRSVVRLGMVRVFGITYPTPIIDQREDRTYIAVNLGGAVIPTIISLFLLYRIPQIRLQSSIAVFTVSLFVWLVAKPVPGAGIMTPALFPPLVTALTALFLGGDYVYAVAYVSGTLGTLIGADLLNLSKIPRLGASVVSIGGAGTFDGIFLTGILAVLLA